ncbi:PAQR family membrane homeostasis protein TrhA [Fundicoccus culcitae]|uniref:Hemolysin III family protein n=1 Tax=Fundicoccus culcitae TaxID=2969821 RepID=A0ABY5P745_9LACT|nr:hemolysin III family protein [Fundicoccus culcitae]UUX34420.1 hemolysin III family protein [Fundicoccus culcitae]
MDEQLTRKRVITAEVLNATTHGIAAILSLVAIGLLVYKGVAAGSLTAIIAYFIYGLSLFILFLNSTLYHSFSFSKYRDLFQRLDHAAIYLLIAGSYTPYLMISIGGWQGYLFLGIIWALALAGIIFEMMNINKWPKLSTYLYLALGWMGILLIVPLFRSVHLNGIILLALGGVAYTVGTIFYRKKSNVWMHVIWHLFVMLGAGLMFFSIYLYV